MKAIDLQSLKKILESYRDKRVMLTFHSIGDTDSIASALALLKYFKNARISTPDFVTSNSRRIMDKLGFSQNLIKNDFDLGSELIVMLDVNNFDDCGPFKSKLQSFKGQILIIDHHALNKIDKADTLVFNDESYNSAASIVYELLKMLGVSIDKKLANMIAAGIISDSAEFKNSTSTTFIQIGELLQKSGLDYSSVVVQMQHIPSPETRAEFIDDLFASNILVSNGLVFVYGQAKFHANKLADDGIKIGADVSLFYTSSKNETSFSARLRPTLDRAYGIHLGELMKSLAPIIKGHGGGHPSAAGAYGPGSGNVKKFTESFLEEIKKKTSTQ